MRSRALRDTARDVLKPRHHVDDVAPQVQRNRFSSILPKRWCGNRRSKRIGVAQCGQSGELIGN
jgi:hypothetical protein